MENKGAPGCVALRGWVAVLRAEVALDGLHPAVSDAEIFDILDIFAVLDVRNIHHKCIVAVPRDLLQIEALDEIDVWRPAACLVDTLTVVMIKWAREGEIICQQTVERLPVPFLSRAVVSPDDLLSLRAQSGSCARSCNLRHDGRRSQCTGTCPQQIAPRHLSFSYGLAHLYRSFGGLQRTKSSVWQQGLPNSGLEWHNSVIF
ncbi:MAG: hypothetical protein ACREV7_21940 [Steroidobacteraceae bacterium]